MKPVIIVTTLFFVTAPALSYSGKCVSGDCSNGRGVYLYDNGNRYSGEFEDYKLNGTGTFEFNSGKWKGGKYTGQWKNNKMHGRGTFYYANGSTYAGEWENNKYNGRGTFTYPYGKEVTGRWRDSRYLGP